MKYSGPYTILEISTEGNCTLKHELGWVAKKKYPLPHLKRYNNLVVGSEEENDFGGCEEVNSYDDEEKEENAMELRKLLDIFDKKRKVRRRVKIQILYCYQSHSQA